MKPARYFARLAIHSSGELYNARATFFRSMGAVSFYPQVMGGHIDCLKGRSEILRDFELLTPSHYSVEIHSYYWPLRDPVVLLWRCCVYQKCLRNASNRVRSGKSILHDCSLRSKMCSFTTQYKGRVFKVSTSAGWLIIATDSKMVDDIRRAGADQLSFKVGTLEVRSNYQPTTSLTYLR